MRATPTPDNRQTATRLASLPSDAGGGADAMTSGDLSISLNGANPLLEECGNSFNDPGATAKDGAGKEATVSVSGTIEAKTVGIYILTYTAAANKDSVSVQRTVIVVDTSPPIITLEGASSMTVSCGETFAEPGALAIDGCQGKLPVAISGSVDSTIQGRYTVTYTATDGNNNTKTVTRTVIVGSIEDNPPTITLNGDAEMTIECDSSFVDPGATATTACSGAVPVTTSGTVEVNTTGSYTITYAATFGALTAEIPRTVTVVDTTPPLISLKGNNPLTILRGTTFTDPGATASDGCAGDFAAAASGTVNPNKVGSYTISYTASDQSGNQATPVKRTVQVVNSLSLADCFPVFCRLSNPGEFVSASGFNYFSVF